MSASSSLEIVLLFGVDRAETRDAITAGIEKLTAEVNAPETNDTIRYCVDAFVGNSELFERVNGMLCEKRNLRLVVVSDQLVLDQQSSESQPTELGKRLRHQFLAAENLERGHICGLIGLVQGHSNRTVDVDHVVDMSSFNLDNLKDALARTAGGIWLKMPNRHDAEVSEDDAVRVQLVRSQGELAECFGLRHRVYGAMGYLADNVMSAKSQIEIDEFDIRSLHFSAIDDKTGDVVGTMRLVVQGVSRFLRDTIVGNPKRVISYQASLCRLIAVGTPDEVFRSKLRQQPFLPLPILQNSDFGEKWPEFLDNTRIQQGGEISRVVVSPRYQGLGVSRLLIRAGIAVAYDLKKEFLLLECIPSHSGMYAKYGFQPLEGHHCRAQGLDQVAVGMKLELDDSPWNQAVSTAKRDIEMLRSQNGGDGSQVDSRFLCLCRDNRCWKDGKYAAFGQSRCPLRDLSTKSAAPHSV